MQNTLLLGLPGSGKTTKILEQFTAALWASSNSVLIVPTLEHASRITDILFQQFEVQGLFNPEQKILTFDKYARQRQSSNASGTPATEMLKLMLIRNILQEQSLSYFRNVQQMKGFTRSLMELFAELKRSLIYPDDLQRIRTSTAQELTIKQRQKLDEIIKIYQRYEEMLNAKKLLDDQDLLPGLINQLVNSQGSGTHHLTPHSEVFIDGFYEFTPAQEELVRQLSRSSNITISMPCREEELSLPMFRHLRKASDFLSRLGFCPVTLNGNQRTTQPPLIHITDNLFKHSTPALNNTDGGLSLLSGNDAAAQVRQIARQIKKLIAENGYRFCDIALIFRGIGHQKQLIPAIFADYQIPVTIHEGEPLENNSLIKFIAHILELLSEKGNADNLLSFLSSAYLEIPLEKISKIKKELDAKPWGGRLKQLKLSVSIPEINKLKEAVSSLADMHSAKNINELVLGLIKDIVSIEGNALTICTDQVARPLTEDLFAFKKLQSLFNEVERLDETGFENQMPPRIYFELLGEALTGSLFTVNDPHPDRVQVYDSRLMQQKEYKVVFVCDLVEKIFPARAKEDSFFKDEERKLFNRGANARLKLKLEDADKEHILFYLAATRASEKLYLCHYRYDESNRETLPSYYIKQVEKLFAPGTIPYITEADSANEIASEEEMLQWMLREGTKSDLSVSPPKSPLKGGLNMPFPETDCHNTDTQYSSANNLNTPKNCIQSPPLGGFRGPNQQSELNTEALYMQIFNYILTHYPERLQSIADKVFRYGKTDFLDPAIVKHLNEQRGAYSISTLEAYAGCPYRYFGQYVLNIQPSAFGFTTLEKGSLLHKVLEIYQSELIKREQIVCVDDIPMLEKTFRELFAPWREKIYPEYVMYTTEQDILKQLNKFLKAEIEFQGKTSFKPAALEKDFYFKMNTRITLRGRIDRIDRDRDNILLIDYKSGRVNLRTDDIEKGKSLQLPVYAMAMQNEQRGQLAGLELYSIKDAERKGMYIDNPSLAGIRYRSSRNKALGQEDFSNLLSLVQGHIKKYVSEIEQGKITCTPIDNECDPFCDFANICRVNKWELK
ncbi:MAG: PD-(D/E)XK nuclease family protein [Candidatus Margulisiibacteriota bacterium]